MKLTVHGQTLRGAARDERTGALVWAPGGMAASRAFAERCHAERLAELAPGRRSPFIFRLVRGGRRAAAALVLLIALLASTTHAADLRLTLPPGETTRLLGYDTRFPCISERFDLGACDANWMGARVDVNAAGWPVKIEESTYRGWTPGQRWIAAGAVLAMVGDVATTAYALKSSSCRGRLKEGNPIVPNVAVLAAYKVGAWLFAWAAGDSFGGRYRTHTWLGIGVPNAAVTVRNAYLIADRCG